MQNLPSVGGLALHSNVYLCKTTMGTTSCPMFGLRCEETLPWGVPGEVVDSDVTIHLDRG